MQRRELLQHLHKHPTYDLVVVGGGATGLGVALDAVLRGFSVLLLEAHDFASGTSSRSTKLLHGGVRYMAQGHLPLVREALRERAAVLEIAPHLAQPLAFVMPAYRWWQRPFYGLGLKLYDLLAGKSALGHTRWLNTDQTCEALPGVATPGLRGGVQYWDGQFEDARLALALARTLQAQGGHVLNYMRVDSVQAHGGTAEVRHTLMLDNQRESGRFEVHARAVVNATGVWVDALRSPTQPALVRASQGVHLVIARDFMPGNQALLVPHTDDGRVLFVVPWLGALILGTTDTPRDDLPREPLAFESEIDFILREAGKVLARKPTRADVQSVWCGLRPLVAKSNPQAGTPTRQLSREHTIVVDPSGMVTVTGGKWTTYRAMAQDVMQACFGANLLPERASGHTAEHTLLGAKAGCDLHRPPSWHLYGTQADAVRACPGADCHLGMGLTEAMVRYAAREEYAWTVEDVLARRWRALFLNSREAREMAGKVAAILLEETGMDPQLAAFEDLCERYTCS